MTEDMTKRRDELAKNHGIEIYPVHPLTNNGFTQDINFARRMSHTQSFQDGWDACQAEMQAQIDNANVKEAYADNFIVQIKCLTEERDTLKAQLELATKKTLSPEECIEIAKAIIKYKYKGRFDLGEF